MIIHFSQIMICLQLLVYCIGGISLLDNEIDFLLKKKSPLFQFEIAFNDILIFLTTSVFFCRKNNSSFACSMLPANIFLSKLASKNFQKYLFAQFSFYLFLLIFYHLSSNSCLTMCNNCLNLLFTILSNQIWVCKGNELNLGCH